MQCQNKITIAYFNNGKSQVMGSTDTVRKSLSINGNYTDEVCNGKIVIEVTAANNYSYDPELYVEWRCSKCGIKVDDPSLPDESNLSDWINSKLT